jgi:hypothetical protein
MAIVTLRYRIQPLDRGWVSVQVLDDSEARLWSYDLPTLHRGQEYCRDSFEARGATPEFTPLPEGGFITQPLLVEVAA